MTTAESVDGEIIRMYSDYLLFEKRVSRKTRDAYAYEASVLLSYARERGVDVSTLDFDGNHVAAVVCGLEGGVNERFVQI